MCVASAGGPIRRADCALCKQHLGSIALETALLRQLGFALIALCLTSPTALAVDSSENAALQYYRAWLHVDFDWLNQEMIDVGRGTVGDPEWQLSDDLIALGLRNRSDTALLGIVEATGLDECDFGTPRDKGPEALLPHLSFVRDSARWLALAARVELEEDRPERAVELLVAGYRLAHHLSQDEIPISSLSAMSIFEMIDGVTALAIERGLDDDLRAQLGDAISIFDVRDPFRIARGVAREGESIESWIQVEFEQTMGAGILEVLKSIRGLNETEEDSARRERAILEVAAQIANGTELRAEREQLRRAYAQAHVALMLKDPEQGEAALTQLSEAVYEGEYGPLAQAIFPSWGRALESLHRSRSLVSEGRDRFAVQMPEIRGEFLDNTLHIRWSGLDEPAVLAVDSSENAALQYWRVFAIVEDEIGDRIDQLSHDQSEGITRFEDSATSRALVQAVETQLDELLAISRMDTCWFAGRPLITDDRKWPHPGRFVRMTRLLELDARVSLDAGSMDRALARVETILGMGYHLRRDRRVISSAAGLAMASVALDVLESVSPDALVHTDESLKRAIRHLTESDPMNVASSFQEETEEYVEWLRARAQAADDIDDLADALMHLAGEENTDLNRNRMNVMLLGVVGATPWREWLDGQLDYFLDYAARIEAGWIADDGCERLQEIERELMGEGRSTHTIAAVLSPALAGLRCVEDELRERANTLRERLGTPDAVKRPEHIQRR